MAIEFFGGLLVLNWILYYFKFFDVNIAIYFSIFLIITWIIYIYRYKEEEKKQSREENEVKESINENKE